MATHPRVLARGTRQNVQVGPRTLVYVPGLFSGWVESELDGTRALVQVGRTFEQAVAALVDDPTPRPQVLVLDFDALTAIELVELCSLRERGWFGSIIALGDIPKALSTQIGIECVLRPPVHGHALREAMAELRFDHVTCVIPRVTG